MAVNETLASFSNTLVYSAMLVYTGALGAFAVDLSGRGRVPASADTAAGAGAGARGSGAQESGAQESGGREAGAVREVMAVGAGSSASGSRTVTVRRSGSADAPGSGRGGSASGVAAAPGTGSGAGTASGSGAGPTASWGAVRTRSKAGGIGVTLTALALLLHLAGVAARGLSVQRAPFGNMYEFAISGSVVVTAVFLLVLSRRDVRYLGTFVVGPVLLTLGLAVAVFYTQAAQLVPALHSFWLIIHVSVAFVASALFTLAFSTTVLQLVQERREAARAAGRVLRRGGFMDALPGATDLERSSYRLHVVAFPLWTFTVIAGAIWAEAAWGKYWNWDPKEVWSFVIWVVYAGYLHARVTRGWDGRRAAYLAIAGYACLLFNFLVVNVFFVGMHSYAGV